ncbi:hypothetical protein ACFL5K_03090 [Gemmatimonadota bacterium]
MPIYLKEKDILSQVVGLKSVLIVPCRFCPAASLAVREKKPYIELFRKFLRTEAYESFIQTLKHRLEDAGIETAVFDSKLPHQFVACMWTSRRRRELAKRAAEFEGVVILGCEATIETVRDSIGSADCRVIKGMDSEGIMIILPTLSFPFNLSLELQGITPMIKEESQEKQDREKVSGGSS